MAKTLNHFVIIAAFLILVFSEIAKIPSNLSKDKSPIIQLVQSPPVNLLPKITPQPTLKSQCPSDLSINIAPASFTFSRGIYTTNEQINSFRNIVGLASIFYRDDIQARLDYISTKMNQTHGINGFGFSVILMSTPSEYFWSIYTYGILASLPVGVDPVNSGASYMFIRQGDFGGRSFFNQIGRIEGNISIELAAVINNIILGVQTPLMSCRCIFTQKIRDLIKAFDGGFWNVFCSSADNQYLSVYARSRRYIKTRPGHCYYAIYNVQS